MLPVFTNLPFPEELLRETGKSANNQPEKVNGHLHSPYSFSAFKNVEQMFIMAEKENVKVLGINDFYTIDGYNEFSNYAMKYRIFPLFNIEFMGILPDEQENNIRVNDANNSGRTYISGKGLKYPAKVNDALIGSVVRESHNQVEKMTERLNEYLKGISSNIKISFNEIREKWAENIVRERHIAKALRIKVFEKFISLNERKDFLEKLLDIQISKTLLADIPSLENTIRARLLKKGGVAYVKENEKAFLEIEKIIKIILDAGGIPCYPVLLDDKDGNYTEFEADPVKLMKKLKKLKVSSIELIPGRNDYKRLKEFVLFFNNNGFVITLGTEHNTPAMKPVTVSCRGERPLDKDLLSISFNGASVIAAHQYLHAQGRKGYIQNDGTARTEEKEYFSKLGNAVIRKFIS